MNTYAVIDTNILVSALLSNHSDSGTVILISRMLSGDIVPLYSPEIIKEYDDVLHRKKFKFDSNQVEYLISSIIRFGIMIEPHKTGEILPDIKDLPFYEVVLEKQKTDNAYLITGNQKHFPIKPFIVTAKEMLDILDLSE